MAGRRGVRRQGGVERGARRDEDGDNITWAVELSERYCKLILGRNDRSPLVRADTVGFSYKRAPVSPDINAIGFRAVQPR